jgi:hypothetical protein
MRRLRFLGIPAAVVILTTACESPIAPDPATGSTVRVTGRVLAYYRATAYSAISGANLVGWIEGGEHAGPTGRIPLNANGWFDMTVDRGARVRLYAGGGTWDELYQPCAVTILAATNVFRDVNLVGDYSLIGAAVPPSFLKGTRTLSGQVFETDQNGGRRPLPWATVSIGGFRAWETEIGWPIAITRTDSDGRYIICGLEANASATVYALGATHEMTVTTVDLRGDTALDIELTRPAAPAPDWLTASLKGQTR